MISTEIEESFWQRHVLAVGVDEAGRGALAGPVVAAAVLFKAHGVPGGMADSKRLTPMKRTRLAPLIRSSGLSVGVAFVNHEVIDAVNILQATFDAMHAAIADCLSNVDTMLPVHLLVDGNRFRPHAVDHTTLVGGDGHCPSIAAASIIAKVERDAWMVDHAHKHYPQYGFNQHKGYGTLLHRTMLTQHGPCPIHRISFLKNMLL